MYSTDFVDGAIAWRRQSADKLKRKQEAIRKQEELYREEIHWLETVRHCAVAAEAGELYCPGCGSQLTTRNIKGEVDAIQLVCGCGATLNMSEWDKARPETIVWDEGEEAYP